MNRLAIALSAFLLAPACDCGSSPGDKPAAKAKAKADAKAAPAPKAEAKPEAKPAPAPKDGPPTDAKSVVAKNATKPDSVAASAVAGRVTWSGDLPAPTSHKVPKDIQRACTPSQDRRVVARGADKGIEGAFVRVTGEAGGKAPATTRLTIAGCRMSPRSATLAAGGDVQIQNTDGVDHTFVARRGGKDLFELKVAAGATASHAVQGAGLTQLIGKDGRDWLQSWIHTGDSGLVAVTGRDGRFRIEPTPDGDVPFEVLHPPVTPGGQPLVVKAKAAVEATKTATVDVELAP